MRVEQLQALAAITRHGSMRRASDALHLSQPALSQTITNLERELGVSLLDRRRDGARLSAVGRELMPIVNDVLDAVQRLRTAADDQVRTQSTIRIGTVHAATVPLVMPAVRAFWSAHPTTQVELVTNQQAEIDRALLEGSLDLGLVNLLAGDDIPPELESVEILRGHTVVCLPSSHPLTLRTAVTAAQLFEHPFIAMRSGYVMHRYAHRLLAGRPARFAYSADGAEMGKLMVAEGLGVTLLPDYSVAGDPLERSGLITYRSLDAADAEVVLVAQSLRTRHRPTTVRRLEQMLLKRGQELIAARS